MKRIISVLLLVTMASVSACSSSNNGANNQSTALGNNPSENTANSGGDSSDTDEITFSIFIDHTWFWMDKWGNDAVSQKITELTGVSFDITRASDGQQLSLLIAADDLPDFVYTANTSTMALLADSDVCYSYNELIEETGVNIHAAESEVKNNTRTDGNYYCLLNAYTSQEAIDEGNTLLSGGTKAVAYRMDIYEAIGSPKLETIDDIENALIAARDMYPGIIPLLSEGTGYLEYFAEQLGVRGAVVGYDEEGNPCYKIDIKGMDDYFRLMNRFAREGLIIPEAMTYNFDKFGEVRNSGNSFMQVRTVDEAMVSNKAALEAGTGYKWKLLTNDLSEEAIVHPYIGIGWSGTFITKKNSNPQKAIEFMSWSRSEEGRQLCSWGIEGEHWEYNSEGLTVRTEQYHKGISEGKLKQDDYGVGVWIFGDQGDENAFIDHNETDPDSQDITERLRSAVAHTEIMSELYFCIPTGGDELNIFNTLNDMYSSEFLKIVFADSEEGCQKSIDDMRAQAEAVGMSRLNAWMREQFEMRQQ